MRVLVVDDESDIRHTTQALLEHFGHEVRTAKNGELAVECATHWRPHFVLVDLSMPVMDGFVATRKLRGLPGSTPMQIVACSAHVQDPLTESLARAAGCDACFVKPMDWERLKTMMAEFERRLTPS